VYDHSPGIQEIAMIMRSMIVLATLAVLSSAPGYAAQPATSVQKTAAAKQHHRRLCPLPTGTRIRPSAATHCDYVAKRPMASFSREELQNTGQFDTANALRRLNPATY
jgi:hypothetical protein